MPAFAMFHFENAKIIKPYKPVFHNKEYKLLTNLLATRKKSIHVVTK